jgi:hypothetical protein
LAKEHGETLFGLDAVRISLEEAERRLLAAGKLLDEQQVGPPAQMAERHALARLEAMLQTSDQTAHEAAPNPSAEAPPGPGDPSNPQQQRRPTFELLQAKTIRMLQADLNERTARFEKRLAAAAPAERDPLQVEGQELAAEQGRLAELVQQMINRDNGDREAK